MPGNARLPWETKRMLKSEHIAKYRVNNVVSIIKIRGLLFIFFLVAKIPFIAFI